MLVPPGTCGAVRTAARVGVAAVGYLALSLLLQHRALPAFATATIGRVSTDATGFTWWLAHTAHALATGANPFVTDLQNFPTGVNALWNTAVPLLGVLLAPITLTAGPVAAFNTGMVLGPVVSGLATGWALGGIVRSRTGRVLAGGLYAFSPFMLAHLQAGHLNLVWAVLPPVLLGLGHRLLVRGPARPWLFGALIGLALASQVVLYTQTVATGVLMFVVFALVVGFRRPVLLLRAGAAAAVTFGLLAAYPLMLVLAGPARPRAPIRSAEYGSADLANTVLPTWVTAVRPVPAPAMQANLGEQGGYLGPVLLLVLAAVLWGGTAARVAAALGAAAWVLALGPQLFVAGVPTGITLPWSLVTDVPLLGEIEPVRFQVYVALAVAVLAGLVLDVLAESPARARVGIVAAVLLAVLAWLPADAQRTTTVAAPAYPQLGGAVVETWPRITSNWYGGADPLRAQIASGFGYRLVGGYFIGSDPEHDVLTESAWNPYQEGAALAVRSLGLPPPDPAVAAADLRARGVTVVLVTSGPGIGPVLDWTRRVTGSVGAPIDGGWVFPLAATLHG